MDEDFVKFVRYLSDRALKCKSFEDFEDQVELSGSIIMQKQTTSYLASCLISSISSLISSIMLLH